MKDSDIEHKFVTIPEAAKIFNRIDSECKISSYIIRRAVNEGKISVRTSGSRMYVDVQSIYEFLKGNPYTIEQGGL